MSRIKRDQADTTAREYAADGVRVLQALALRIGAHQDAERCATQLQHLADGEPFETWAYLCGDQNPPGFRAGDRVTIGADNIIRHAEEW
jgi:hypothetical protein